MEAPSPQQAMSPPQSMLPHRPRSSTGNSSNGPAPRLPHPYGAASPRSSSNFPFTAHQSTAQTYGSPNMRPPTHYPSHPNAIGNQGDEGGIDREDGTGGVGGSGDQEGGHRSPNSRSTQNENGNGDGDGNGNGEGREGNTRSNGPPPPSDVFSGSQLPSPPLLSQLFALSSPSRPLVLPPKATSHRWATGQGTYANANLLIGREDPRLNAISMGIVPMARARALMIL